MGQFTKAEAELINNWLLNERLKVPVADNAKHEQIEVIRVKLIQLAHDIDLVDETKLEYHFTPAAAFEAMSEKKYKARIDKLERENAVLKHNNKSIRAKNEILKETDRVVILRGAEIQKSEKEAVQIIDALIHAMDLGVESIIDCAFFKAKDFINNKCF